MIDVWFTFPVYINENKCFIVTCFLSNKFFLFYFCVDILESVHLCYYEHRYMWHDSSKMAVHVRLCTKLEMHGVTWFLAAEGNKPANICHIMKAVYGVLIQRLCA